MNRSICELMVETRHCRDCRKSLLQVVQSLFNLPIIKVHLLTNLTTFAQSMTDYGRKDFASRNG